MVPDLGTWAGLIGAAPDDALVDLAERLTGASTEVEVVRLLVDEVERRVTPGWWTLLIGDRHELRVEHVGGKSPPQLLRRLVLPAEIPVWSALDTFEAQLLPQPDPAHLVSLSDVTGARPEDAVILPFGGFEVVGCLELVDVSRSAPSYAELESLRRALRLGGVGLRNARRHRRLTGPDAVDEITGLEGPNRFRTTLERELDRTERNRRPTSVLLVDLDGFKAVHREHGRLVGASLLAEVGGILQLSLRRVDCASRWAGDTFALLLPETDQEGAQQVARRIQGALRDRDFDVGSGDPVRFTASVGIAIFETKPDDPERIIHAAEMAMRSAQAQGEPETLAFASTGEAEST
ncbi:MAG: GGDEF domain-containing protein [Myxococcota bacterium]